MKISHLVQEKGSFVATIPKESTVRDALAELARVGVGALVVSPDVSRIDGIVSERDIVRHLNRRGAEVLERPVSDLMSSSVLTCAADSGVEWVMRLMTEQRIRHVPVLDGEVLVGIVSIGDVVKSRIEELESERTALLNYVGAR